MNAAEVSICAFSGAFFGVMAYQLLSDKKSREEERVRFSAKRLVTLVDSWGGWDITKISELRAALEKLRAALEGKQ